MGRPTLEKVRSETPSLPKAEFRNPALDLVASLSGLLVDPDVASAWDAEILRRLAEIDSGTANLIDREEFCRCMCTPISRSCCGRSSTRQRERPAKLNTVEDGCI